MNEMIVAKIIQYMSIDDRLRANIRPMRLCVKGLEYKDFREQNDESSFARVLIPVDKTKKMIAIAVKCNHGGITETVTLVAQQQNCELLYTRLSKSMILY